MSEKIVLVDGNSLMHRAFHALPLLNNSRGEPTNAVYGFLSMLLKVLSEEQPQYCAVAFDLHGPTFRHAQYADYKAGRPATPDELHSQFPLVKRALAAMHIALLSLESYEADDLLGTFSRRAGQQGVESVLVTGDRDSFQLVDGRTCVLYTKRGITDTERVTPEYIMEKYGVSPVQMIDVKGLMGDASDNIPGVPGVGEKTATRLIAQYGSLEEVLARVDEQKGKLRERLTEFADQARMSLQIATIDRDAPLDVPLEDLRVGDVRDALPVYQELELKSLLPRLARLGAERAGAPDEPTQAETSPAEQPDERWAERRVLDGADALRQALPDMCGAMALCTGEALELALEDGTRLSVPLGGDLLNPGADEDDLLRALAPLLESEACLKILGDAKSLRHRLCRLGVALKGEIHDVRLAAYALNPQRKSFAVEALLEEEGLDARDPARGLFLLKQRQAEALERDDLTRLYREIELPLQRALYDMEKLGFAVDAQELRRLGEGYNARIEELTQTIYDLAGGPFNINSPKQLGELLYERLGLKAGRKTKSGYSTDAETLEQLDHPIAAPILEYRKYKKLQGTYIEGLLSKADADGRIHTSFDQTATATGRISSLEPNLQNIPVRTELGRDIRRAFVAQDGWVLVDADYSQIELRVLASMSGDEVMCEAFRLDQDIHRRTAAEVYGVPLDQVTAQMRSNAKAVNFGIVYGISDFGLARNIGVTRKQAAEFIETYLSRYAGIRRFMEEAVARGKAEGYVSTLMGRRRYLPELSSSSHTVRAFGERAAMNSPIQGTAADIIKLAMVRAHAALAAQNLRARLILQVHDELIVEAPPEEAERVQALLRDCMEHAAQLNVPLKADISVGRNWYECK